MHSKALGHIEALVLDMRRYLDSNLASATVRQLVSDRVDDALGMVDAVETVTQERLSFLEQANGGAS